MNIPCETKREIENKVHQVKSRIISDDYAQKIIMSQTSKMFERDKMSMDFMDDDTCYYVEAAQTTIQRLIEAIEGSHQGGDISSEFAVGLLNLAQEQILDGEMETALISVERAKSNLKKLSDGETIEQAMKMVGEAKDLIEMCISGVQNVEEQYLEHAKAILETFNQRH